MKAVHSYVRSPPPGYAFELAELIREQVKAQRPMSVRDASLLELESVLRLFVQQVDGFAQAG